MDSEQETKLISLISQLVNLDNFQRFVLYEVKLDCESEIKSLVIQIIHHVSSMDLDSQPKPESELMSLVTQTISLFNSTDLDSQPKPLSQLISLLSQKVSLDNALDTDLEFSSLLRQTVQLDPQPELVLLICQIVFLVVDSKFKKLISLRPQVTVRLRQGKFHVDEHPLPHGYGKWYCLPTIWEQFRLAREDATHFFCRGCYGKNHERYDEAPVEIKHLLHPKHFLQLAVLSYFSPTRKCYCCDEDLIKVFYCCAACDFAINIACAEKPPVLSINHPRWHEHTLAWFPRRASLVCNVCALPDSTSPIYMCPPCDFVVHLRCISLPRVIRISRHLHRIGFTQSFDQGDWSCGVCRTKIDNDCGGYSCTKTDCSYTAHSRCATQRNVWDGLELEGEPEEKEEKEVEPFVGISDGIIQYFTHQLHHLTLNENTGRDYDEDKICQACVMPIYFGKYYSCMQCEFILHETCANLPRKTYTPIHPHLLTLVGGKDDVHSYYELCAACGSRFSGFFYKCGKEDCDFQLHVQCATISEPLVHGSHAHPLFLTSKPEEQRECCVCKSMENETFNCIECECSFTLCFRCATLPEKVRYKHDDHMLTLSYGKETSTMMYWCEACEGQVKPKERFYTCDEYCCVTLHIDCLLGKVLYMKPGSSFLMPNDEKVSVLSNNHHMSRPICCYCKKRCPGKVVFQFRGKPLCSIDCLLHFF
ncbi:Cysteine/Histidine-rich C1 domain family protein [Raphanus sativus]|uniref:Uncharacterized protein LOC108811261 n=1 Tax=Raphanus sativus TaxID=3726 RepID=A0A6J0JSZ6_RAPSA|nr:uncharacterized protein LOC108811261 [Raphanus sativus]KAJ4887664.1 Cysteine/Histidine-rich C1 domain family protein [Raphanus sativus]